MMNWIKIEHEQIAGKKQMPNNKLGVLCALRAFARRIFKLNFMAFRWVFESMRCPLTHRKIFLDNQANLDDN